MPRLTDEDDENTKIENFRHFVPRTISAESRMSHRCASGFSGSHEIVSVAGYLLVEDAENCLDG